MQTNLPMYACTTWFSTTDMFQDVHMPSYAILYLHIARKTDTSLANKKQKKQYIVYTYAVYKWIWYDLYIYIDVYIFFTSIYKPRFNYKKNVRTRQCHRSAPIVEVNILCLQPFGVELVSRSVHVITLWCVVRVWKSWEHWWQHDKLWNMGWQVDLGESLLLGVGSDSLKGGLFGAKSKIYVVFLWRLRC